ncbi:hypothetical protein TNIN_170301 [Trichonephila inaurata madagascariensis]|uniref:Uncharacterized protein n=1 Tax=Trichonephila inaurata madagascariensis TaxID=2747483 RepID=A0A8X6JTJ2_9ARAC|nr:hypothetical protein TNIN_170301 [Trichonephila inaurata madagascariensis]
MRSAPVSHSLVWKLDKMEFELEIVQRSYFVSQLQEFGPYCIEDTDKSTTEEIVPRINLENAENFKNHYSALSNTSWIGYSSTQFYKGNYNFSS